MGVPAAGPFAQQFHIPLMPEGDARKSAQSEGKTLITIKILGREFHVVPNRHELDDPLKIMRRIISFVPKAWRMPLYFVNKEIFTRAIKNDKLEPEFSPPRGPDIRFIALAKGNFAFIRWISSKLPKSGWKEVDFVTASERGERKLLKWLKDRCPLAIGACTAAAELGHLKALKWLYAHGYPWDETAFIGAVKIGQTDVVKFLMEKGCPHDERATEGAALGGYLGLLLLLITHGCPWHKISCMEAAAEGGHVHILKWLHSQRCAWHPAAYMHAARYGKLNVIEWLHRSGCPWDEYAVDAATTGNHWKILEFLRDHGCPNETLTPYDELIKIAKQNRPV